MTRVIKYLFLVLCFALLAIGFYQIASAQPKTIPNTAGANSQQPLNGVSLSSNSAEPAGVQENIPMRLPVQPATWFGLAASLSGAVVFWMSVMWMAKRRHL